MWIRCGQPFSSPTVVRLTVATSPFSTRVALPLPVTRFFGTGLATAAKRWPTGVLVEDADLLGEEPEASTITAATPAPISATRATASHRYRLTPVAGG